jgi:hypothetical protein
MLILFRLHNTQFSSSTAWAFFAVADANARRVLRRLRFVAPDPLVTPSSNFSVDSTVVSEAGTLRGTGRYADSSNLVSDTTSNSAVRDLGYGGTYFPILLTLRRDRKHFTLKLAGRRSGLLAIATDSHTLAKHCTETVQSRFNYQDKKIVKLTQMQARYKEETTNL